MNRTLLALVSIVLVMVLSSCAGQFNRAQSGAGIGAAGGALIGQAIGHNTGATIIGAAVGTMAGYIVGNEMDKYDNQQLGGMYERGLSSQTTSWRNPDSGHVHSVTPQAAVRTETGICRTAQIESTIDGGKEAALATACRDEYGTTVIFLVWFVRGQSMHSG